MSDLPTTRVLHLSVGDPFTARLLNSQVRSGWDIHLATLISPTEVFRGVALHRLPFAPPFGYYLNMWRLRKLLCQLAPDLLHVHYGTGNGTLGRLANYRPCVLSVWGSDIMITPHRSRAMRKRVVRNLAHYDCVCATSKVLMESTRDLYPALRDVEQTPIGVDTSVFLPTADAKDPNVITIGTIKTMEPTYGIDVLLRAFAVVKRRVLDKGNPHGKYLRLLIVGGGQKLAEYRALANSLGIGDESAFIGQVPNHAVPDYLNRMDIFVALSRAESFGVAVLEASACELPVVVSKIGGLPEVTVNGVTGFIVPPEDPEAAGAAIERLCNERSLRLSMGRQGREFVRAQYEWSKCLDTMMSVYARTMGRHQ